MTSIVTDLKGMKVMLSAALPDELAGTGRAQDFYDLLVVLTGGILSSGGCLVFGGHPSVTPLVHRAARSTGVETGQVKLFQAEKYRTVAPEEILDTTVFGEVQWAKDLDSMRDDMAAAADAAVFVGGKAAKYPDAKPGIRAEWERFLHHHPEGPAYFLGALGGEAARIIAEGWTYPRWGPRYLTESQRRLLETTDSVDLGVSLILTDLAKIVAHANEKR